MIKRFLPLLVIAFATGILFRIGNRYGIPLFRMFGTWGIVAIGIWGAAILKSLQLNEGVRRVEEVLSRFSDKVNVTEAGRVGKLPVWVLQTDRGKILLGSSDVAQSASAPKAERLLSDHATKIARAAAEGGLVPDSQGVLPAIVLLRRQVDTGEHVEVEAFESPVSLVNPEDLGLLVKG